MTIIIDASAFCAQVNQRDMHYNKSRNIFERLKSENEDLITTDYIFDESLGVITRKMNRHIAKVFGENARNSEIDILLMNAEIFDKAWGVFLNSEEFSFTDCTTVMFMKMVGITKIVTFDKAFKNIKGIDIIDS